VSGNYETCTVTVATQSTTNPLWTRGFLKQDASDIGGVTTFHHPSHFDGTYFLWHGDSVWGATTQACRNQWRSYIDNRAANGFTVVHLALSPRWGGPLAPAGYSGIRSNMSGGLAPFQQLAGTCPSSTFNRESKFPNCQSRWNFPYWQELDGMIQYANSQGILVFLAGVNGPYDEWISDAAIKSFARNLAALTRGNFVILSPGLDDDPSLCEPGYGCAVRRMSHLLDVAGEEIRTLSGVYPIITNHFASIDPNQIDDSHAESWLNVDGYQSGFAGTNLNNLTSRPRTLAQAIRYPMAAPFTNPRKPAVNTEAIYDWGYPVTSEASTSVQHYNRYRARQAGWSSWFAGATGYSWGQVGLWEWGICGLSPLPSWAVAAQSCVNAFGATPQSNEYKNYAGAMCQSATANSAERMVDALRTLDFATLAAGPNEQNRVTSVPAPATPRKFVAARDPDGLLVYMPHNANVRVNLSGTGLESGFEPYLYNPRAHVPVQTPVCSLVSGATYQFENPLPVSAGTVGTADWILLLSPRSTVICSSGFAALGEPELGFFAAESEGGVRGLWAHPIGSTDATSLELVEQVQAELPRKWSAARDDSGNTLVVWEYREGFGTLSEIRARWLDDNARPLGEAFVVSAVQGRDQLAPSVGVGPSGESIAAWVERDPLTGASEVLATPLSLAGVSGVQPTRLDRESVLIPRRTRSICAASSGCFVAWEAANQLTGAVSARYRAVDVATAFPSSSVRQLRDLESELWVGRPEVDAGGRAFLSWEEFDGRGRSVGRFASFLDSGAE
jgi:hypothetical protein